MWDNYIDDMITNYKYKLVVFLNITLTLTLTYSVCVHVCHHCCVSDIRLYYLWKTGPNCWQV